VLSAKQAPALASLLAAQVCATSWFGPVFAAIQDVVRPERRALAAAVLLALVTLIGLGLGPAFVGLWNDLLRPSLGEHSIARSLLALLSFEVLAVAFLARAALRAPGPRAGA
jgi:hypothetical protein